MHSDLLVPVVAGPRGDATPEVFGGQVSKVLLGVKSWNRKMICFHNITSSLNDTLSKIRFNHFGENINKQSKMSFNHFNLAQVENLRCKLDIKFPQLLHIWPPKLSSFKTLSC